MKNKRTEEEVKREQKFPRNKNELDIFKRNLFDSKDEDIVGVDKIRAIINPKVRERDSDRCCFCGKDVHEVSEEIGGGNTIHHIIPRRYGGEHKEDNLITICAYCHTRLEKYLAIIENLAVKRTIDFFKNKEEIKDKRKKLKLSREVVNGLISALKDVQKEDYITIE